MKRYLLPLAICFFWTTPIQVSAAGVCPEDGEITPQCKKYLKNNEYVRNGDEVVKCIEEIQNNEAGSTCISELKKAESVLPREAWAEGSAADTSPLMFIKFNKFKLKEQLKNK